MSKSRVRRERTSSPLFERRGPTQAPSHSLSRPPGASQAGAPGRAQTSGSPSAPGRAETPGYPQSHTPTTRALGHRDDPGDNPGATPDAPVRAGAGPPHGHSPAAAAPRPPRPLPRPHSRRQFPRGVRAGAASPPDPPSGARRARPGYGESRRRPLSSLLPQCVPPTEARLVFPGSGLSESLASEPRASGLPSGAVARQAQRWHCRGLPKVISRGFPHSNRRAGAHRKGGQLE